MRPCGLLPIRLVRMLYGRGRRARSQVPASGGPRSKAMHPSRLSDSADDAVRACLALNSNLRPRLNPKKALSSVAT